MFSWTKRRRRGRRKRRFLIAIALLLAASVLIFTVSNFCFYLRLSASKKEIEFDDKNGFLETFRYFDDFADFEESFKTTESVLQRMVKNGQCTTANGSCLDRGRCRVPTVAVYPDPPFPNIPPVSERYGKILTALKRSRFFTANLSEACLFVLSFDTLDRDKISGDFVPNMNTLIDSLPPEIWNGGRNHLIFNLYHGTYPQYRDDDFSFQPGLAMLARASTHVKHFRPNYDLSFPLFHKDLPLEATDQPAEISRGISNSDDEYFLSFKGKRYVYGIGSETRNAVYHLHNAHSTVMLTTCKHNEDWWKHQDPRCSIDNVHYDRWNYTTLLSKSTYCLVPRGRRLGSYRFLEALKVGCIPVILSDNWQLPFSDLIDWSVAVVTAPERSLFLISDMLKSIGPSRVSVMKENGRRIFRKYFSSVESIVHTALTIIFNRIDILSITNETEKTANNYRPSSPVNVNRRVPFSGFLPEYGMWMTSSSFSALIYAGERAGTPRQSQLRKLLAAFSAIPECKKIVVLWNMKRNDRDSLFFGLKSAATNERVDFVDIASGNYSELFVARKKMTKGGVFTVDEHVSLSSGQIRFAFKVWQWFPSRLVGFIDRSHQKELASSKWHYSPQSSSNYSMIIPVAAIFHGSYLELYERWVLGFGRKNITANRSLCNDLLLNNMLTEYTKRPPIKLASSRKMLYYRERKTSATNFLMTRSDCFEALLRSKLWNGHPPFIHSQVLVDSQMFPIDNNRSNIHKKYRLMENIV